MADNAPPVALNALEVIDNGNTKPSQRVEDRQNDDIQSQVSKQCLQSV